ncbi:MAG: AIR synthase-related protein [Candidatus Uhrbacteria bacterium]|nr:AIR synthase-related protein [Candidatus Uhrbacteria bacterium]
MLFESSGLHANGITMIWKDIIPKLPDGYNTLLSDGKEFGEALVAPTILYSPIIKALQDVGIIINYAVNITGHGWRKLMRAKRPFVYHIDMLPEPQPVFDFIQRMGPVEEQEMWGTYNMGAGFALYVDPDFTEEIINYAEKHCIRAWKAGRVEEDGGRKAVVIDNGRVVFAADTMNLRS